MCHNMSFTSLMSLYVNGVSMGGFGVSFHVRSMSLCRCLQTYSNKQPKVLSLGLLGVWDVALGGDGGLQTYSNTNDRSTHYTTTYK